MNLSPAEVRDQTSNHDAAAVGQHEVRFTNVKDFLADLERDYKADSITDKIVRVSVVAGPASINQVSTRGFVPGGDRHTPFFQSKYLTASYLARGQLVKLSAYCGVVHIDPSLDLERGEATALQVQEKARSVAAVLDRKRDLDVRGGSLYVEDGDWLAGPDFTIEEVPEELCATCGWSIYFANERWRHKQTRQAEHYVPNTGPGRAKQMLHHLADPFIKERKL